MLHPDGFQCCQGGPAATDGASLRAGLFKMFNCSTLCWDPQLTHPPPSQLSKATVLQRAFLQCAGMASQRAPPPVLLYQAF